MARFTEVAVGVTKERKEQWKRLYDEYRGESTSLYDKKCSKEERDVGFTKLYQGKISGGTGAPKFRCYKSFSAIGSEIQRSSTDALDPICNTKFLRVFSE